VTLQDLIDEARSRSGDTSDPPFTLDSEWTRFANDGEREAARRARLILDSSTAAVCQLALVAGQATATLDPRVLFIRRAKLVGRSMVLRRISRRDLDNARPDWEDESDEPSAFVPDMDTGKFRPYPRPLANGVVKLTACRLPLEDMKDLKDEPEIGPHLHMGIVDWMLFRHYSKQDQDVRDEKKAAEHLAAFEAEFGKKSSAIDEHWIEQEHGYDENEGLF